MCLCLYGHLKRKARAGTLKDHIGSCVSMVTKEGARAGTLTEHIGSCVSMVSVVFAKGHFVYFLY